MDELEKKIQPPNEVLYAKISVNSLKKITILVRKLKFYELLNNGEILNFEFNGNSNIILCFIRWGDVNSVFLKFLILNEV